VSNRKGERKWDSGDNSLVRVIPTKAANITSLLMSPFCFTPIFTRGKEAYAQLPRNPELTQEDGRESDHFNTNEQLSAQKVT
jgi:hypothetical protein